MTQVDSQSQRRPTYRPPQLGGLALLLTAIVPLAAPGCWSSSARVQVPDFNSVRVRQEAKATQLLAAEEVPPLQPLPTSGATENEWQPVAPARSWRYIVLHHSGTEGGSVESIDAAHRQRTDADGHPWLGIGYHFVVGNGGEMADGEIAPTFRWQQQLAGAHAGDSAHNAAGIGVCAIGDFDAEPPSELQLQSLRRLLTVLAKRYDIPPTAIVPHSDLKATNCPGQQFPLQELAAATQSAATDHPLSQQPALFRLELASHGPPVAGDASAKSN